MSKQERLLLLQRPNGGKSKHLWPHTDELRQEVKEEERLTPEIRSRGRSTDQVGERGPYRKDSSGLETRARPNK